MRASGTLPDWKKTIGALARGNSRLMFVICAALLGPVLDIFGMAPIGFSLVDSSSIGKTTALKVAGSVYGCAIHRRDLGYIKILASTIEGIEKFARAANDGLLLLDETRGLGTDKELGKLMARIVMRLGEGVEKTRPNCTGLREAWRVVFLVSSNRPVAEMFQLARLEFDDAYRTRLSEIKADADCGYGVFENLHGAPSAVAFVKELENLIQQHFGSAMNAFLRRLVYDRKNRPNTLHQRLAEAPRHYQDLQYRNTASAVDGRTTDKFSAVFAAGTLATSYGVLSWPLDEIAWAIQSCERAHTQFLVQLEMIDDMVEPVRQYIINNRRGFRRLPDPSITTKAKFNDAPGYILIKRSSLTQYVFPRPVFEAEFQNFGSNRVLSGLAARCFLDFSTTKNGVRPNGYQKRVPITNRSTD